MIRQLPLASLLLGTLMACSETSDRAEAGPQLLVPDDVFIHWDASFNSERDGIGALIPVDVMVYEGITGAPLGEVVVELESNDTGIWLLLDEDFDVVGPEVCVDCPFVWDARRDQYFVLRMTDAQVEDISSDPLSVEPGEDGIIEEWAGVEALDDLHRIMLHTDAGGLARVYLFVDSFPWDEEMGDFGPVSVLVSLGAMDAPPHGTRAFFELFPR